MSAAVHKLFPTASAETVEQEFERWYQRYPRKESRGTAIRAFRTARKKATMEELVNGLARYTQDCVGRERRFIALPATWLNGERWLDELEAPAIDDRDYARLRAFQTRGLWLESWGPRPKKIVIE